jgi:4-amino-4-deoxy-L-arabinose transferase-like glycosyltransferase
MEWIVIWGVVAVASAALAAVLAGIKNRDYSYWIGWCFLFPPLVIWLMLMPKNRGPRPRQPRLDEIDRHDQHDRPL